jgi:hypothetical protein
MSVEVTSANAAFDAGDASGVVEELLGAAVVGVTVWVDGR